MQNVSEHDSSSGLKMGVSLCLPFFSFHDELNTTNVFFPFSLMLLWNIRYLNSVYLMFLSFQTTIIAVEFDGGVVVGSDSRVSAG